jgi:uncharacterized protein
MSELRVGIISDTHGILRKAAIESLRGSDLIIHAGDIGDPAILKTLDQIAPTTAVRGNTDRSDWAKSISETEVLEAGELSLYIIHDYSTLDLNPRSAGFHAVIYGHSHRASIDWQNGVLLLNPGSAGPRRFHQSVTLALLSIKNKKMYPEIIRL